MKNIAEKYNVSHETITDLNTYHTLLIEWQEKINLVSDSSLLQAKTRHFEDSVQLFKYIPKGAETLIDFGSGAGFPALVLAIIAKTETPYLNISMVESIKKKTVFLKEVAEKTGTKVQIINDRIENVKTQKFDVITSRAMTSLDNLLNYSYRFCSKNTVCIFPKGKKYAEELSLAHKKWNFKCCIEPSSISDEGKILIITKLSKKGENKCQEF